MAEPRNNLELGKFIVDLRIKRDLSQAALAKQAGVDRTYLSRLEHGKYQRPAPDMLSKIANALTVNAATLYRMAGYAESNALPDFRMYMRSKYDASPKVIDEMWETFEVLSNMYDEEVPKQ